VVACYTTGMFIRETRKTAKGKRYIQHQLIASVRTSAGPRQKLVLNLGFVDLSRDKWKALANAIESRLHNQSQLFPEEEEIEKLAQHYARIIIRERLNKQVELDQKKKEPEEDASEDYETVDLNSLAHSDAKTLGAEHVALTHMQHYHIDRILKEHGFDDRQIAYAKMLIVGRMVHPASERETARWVNEDSAICELLQTNCRVYDNAFHRTAILLWEKHESIEEALANEATKLFSLKETIILYDLTNTYFEGSKRGSKIAKPARSKDKRNDRPLVTLALAVDEQGFPKKSRVLEGNVSEPGTLAHILDELSFTDQLGSEKTIVIDAGIASEDNLKLIRDKGFDYVAVSRKRSYPDDFWRGSFNQEIQLSGKVRLNIKSERTEEEVFLLCHSEAKEAKEKAIVERRMNKFEQELSNIRKGLSKKGTRKGYGKIREKIGRVKEKYGVGTLYDIEVTQKEGIATDISFCINPHGKAKQEGVGDYVLRTTRCDLTDEAISKIHRSLTTVEDSFRNMKSELGIRPNYHKRDDPTVAHIFITVIAYHILAGILKKLRSNGISYNWDTLRKLLLSHVRVTTSFNTKDTHTVHVRTSTTPTAKQRDIYRALKISQKPLKRIKVKIPVTGSLCIDNPQ